MPRRAKKPKITVRHKAGTKKITVTVDMSKCPAMKGKRPRKKLYGAAAKAHAKKVARRRRRS